MTVETYRFQVGAFQCIALNDGSISNIPIPSFFPNAPANQLQEVLHRYGVETEKLTVACVCLLVDTGQNRVLLETGGGTEYHPYGQVHPDFPPVQPKLGGLLAGLAAEGISPDSIDTVILSHAHGDHISGSADSMGKPVFPNARYVMARGEWEGFITEQIPDDDNEWNGWAASMRYAQKQCKALQDRMVLPDPETEVVPGVCLIPTPGHSVAHCSVEFQSGTARLVCPVDTLGHPIAIEYPDWGPTAEHELESRRRILNRAGSTALVHVFHHPFPGLGHLVPNRDGWLWRAI